MRRCFRPRLAMLALLLGVAALYAPSLHFGFVWDDPQWLGRVIDRSPAELIRPSPTFQFYRPGTMLYNRLFAQAGGTFTPFLLHAAQIGWHLLNVALLYALARRLGLDGWRATAVSVLFAVYPFSHQAVAWAAPQQPLALALQQGAWLAFLRAQSRRRGSPAVVASLFLFGLALTVQESAVVMAAVPFLLSWPRTSRWRLLLAYPLLAAAFALVWLLAPRAEAIIDLSWSVPVWAYLSQGVAYPLLWRPGGYDLAFAPNEVVVLMLAVGTVGVLLTLARRQSRGRLAVLGLLWAGLGVAPALFGLPYSYVKLGARLLYYAAPGVALLWVCGVASGKGAWGWLRWLLIGLVAFSGAVGVWQFNCLWQPGAAHLQALVNAAQQRDATQIHVNFPDRYADKRPPFPLGYWGLTLAPVVQQLSDYAAIVDGQAPPTTSYAMPWLDKAAREEGPYEVDMRGVIVNPAALYERASPGTAVYLSRYRPDGTFALQRAGERPLKASGACRATFGDKLCLLRADTRINNDVLVVALWWLSLQAADPNDTIFVHLGPAGQQPVAQADGDLWLGMLPLPTLKPGDTIAEQRYVPVPVRDDYVLNVGVYDRVTGQRLPIITAEGKQLPENLFTVPLPAE